MVLARNRAAFLSRHPDMEDILLAGEYGLGASNQFSNKGEEVALSDASGADIVRFTYGEDVPWPATADGDGPERTYTDIFLGPGCQNLGPGNIPDR